MRLGAFARGDEVLGTAAAATPYDRYMAPVKQVFNSIHSDGASMDRVNALMRQGRAFRYVEGGWHDETISGKPTVVLVKFGSDAYFKLAAVSKEWSRMLSLGRAVTFRTGKSTVVKVGEKGAETLTDAEVKALEK